MKLKVIAAAAIAMLCSTSIAMGQFNWNQPLDFGGSIKTEVYQNHDTIVVTGTFFNDKVEVERLGQNALVSLYTNGRLVQQKLVRGNSPTYSLPNDRFQFWQDNGRKLCLLCELKGGNDSFECDSPIFYSVEVGGGAGNDTIYAGPTQTIAFGGAGNDTIVGGPGADYLNGGEGNDYIRGGEGDDFIVGGYGSDLISSIGSNSFDGVDTVYTGATWFGYQHEEDDAIDYFWLDSLDEAYTGAGDYGTISVFFD